jgi:hypothetical protein
MNAIAQRRGGHAASGRGAPLRAAKQLATFQGDGLLRCTLCSRNPNSFPVSRISSILPAPVIFGRLKGELLTMSIKGQHKDFIGDRLAPGIIHIHAPAAERDTDRVPVAPCSIRRHSSLCRVQ